MNPQEQFVTRLRRHRQRNGLSLDEIASEMRIKVELLDALEKNDLSEWPRGLYARAWIRAYAVAVGVDPNDTVDEFCRLFPQGDRRTSGTIKEIAAIVAEPSEYQDEFNHPADRRRRTTDPAPVARLPWHATVTHGARAIWVRLATAAGPHLRTRRAPRTSM